MAEGEVWALAEGRIHESAPCCSLCRACPFFFTDVFPYTFFSEVCRLLARKVLYLSWKENKVVFFAKVVVLTITLLPFFRKTFRTILGKRRWRSDKPVANLYESINCSS